MEPDPPHMVHESMYRQRYDKIVDKLDEDQVQALFEDLNEEADRHPPHTRQLYLALYRRLHG
jgi:hypothetical protein